MRLLHADTYMYIDRGRISVVRWYNKIIQKEIQSILYCKITTIAMFKFKDNITLRCQRGVIIIRGGGVDAIEIYYGISVKGRL